MDKTNWGQLTQLGDGLRMMEERRDSAIPPSSSMAMVGDDVSLHTPTKLKLQIRFDPSDLLKSRTTPT